jgi:hypothetical protein
MPAKDDLDLKGLLTKLSQDISELKFDQEITARRLTKTWNILQRIAGPEQFSGPGQVTMPPRVPMHPEYYHPPYEKIPGIAYNVSGSFVITTCVSNSVLRISGVAGNHLKGQTVEVFDANGNKVDEIGTVDNNGKFDGRVGPPNPFRTGDTVIIRIGPDVGQAIAD